MAETAPASSSDAQGSSDPLSKLHKMSMTAGVSAQDYAAINLPSLIALFFGLLSVLVVLSPVLLFLPAIAVVCGIVSLIQISRSSGTQTGKGFAYPGLILGLLFGGFQVTKAVTDRMRARGDEAEIAAIIQSLGDEVTAGDYDAVYACFTKQFKQNGSRELVETKFRDNQRLVAPLRGMEWNKIHMSFRTDQATKDRLAEAVAIIHFQGDVKDARMGLVFRNVDGKWLIDDIPGFFFALEQSPSTPQ